MTENDSVQRAEELSREMERDARRYPAELREEGDR